jgi:hypothetical protein
MWIVTRGLGSGGTGPLVTRGLASGNSPTPTPTTTPFQWRLVATLVPDAEDADDFGVDADRTIEIDPS